MIVMRFKARWAASLAAACSLLAAGPLLAGCGGPAAGTGGAPRVAASFYPFEFLARQVGGPDVDVVELTKPGVEPHDADLSPRQIGTVSTASLVLYLRGMAPAVDKAVAENPP